MMTPTGNVEKHMLLGPLTRRYFVSCLGGAAIAYPLAARAQQPAMPVIGFLHSASDTLPDRMRGFRQGLKDTGYVEGDNVAIVHRWADNQVDRLPDLVAELARRQIAVFAIGGNAAALAAKATTTIPIVFIVNEDPVRLGLVASLAKPGGSLTGVNFLAGELTAKRLGLLREFVPTATRVAVLVIRQCYDCGVHVERRGTGCACPGAANPGPRDQYQPRDRRSLRYFRARAARCAVRRPRSLFLEPACPIGPPGDAPRAPRLIWVA